MRSFFSSLYRRLGVRLSAIVSDLNGNICFLCLRSSAVRPTQTASDGRRPLQIIWKPGFRFELGTSVLILILREIRQISSSERSFTVMEMNLSLENSILNDNDNGFYVSKKTKQNNTTKVTHHNTNRVWPTHRYAYNRYCTVQESIVKSNQLMSNRRLLFEERGKPKYPEKNLSEQSREPTNSTYI